ncbi:MAG TPA: hypothetical protein VGE24_03890, partial [Emticicia sp.]
ESLEVKPIMVWEVERAIDKRVQEGIKRGVDEKMLQVEAHSNKKPDKIVLNTEQTILYQRIKENVIDIWYSNQIDEREIDDELEVILKISNCKTFEEVLDLFEGLTVQQIAENNFMR